MTAPVPTKMSDVDRTLRSCGLNAIVRTVAVLGDPKNKRTWAVIVLIPEPLLQWAIEANKEFRKGVEANQKWLYIQQTGGACGHILDCMMQLVNPDVVQIMVMNKGGETCLLAMTSNEVDFEEEMATFAGRYTYGLAALRLRRLTYLFGYPHRMNIFAHNKCKQELAKFKKAHATGKSVLGILQPFQSRKITSAGHVSKGWQCSSCPRLPPMVNGMHYSVASL